MLYPLRATGQGTVSSSGKLSITLGGPPPGRQWQGTVTVTNAAPFTTFQAVIGGQVVGSWTGTMPFGPVQLAAGEQLVVTGAQLTNGQRYTAVLQGSDHADGEAAPAAPQPIQGILPVQPAVTINSLPGVQQSVIYDVNFPQVYAGSGFSTPNIGAAGYDAFIIAWVNMIVSAISVVESDSSISGFPTLQLQNPQPPIYVPFLSLPAGAETMQVEGVVAQTYPGLTPELWVIGLSPSLNTNAGPGGATNNTVTQVALTGANQRLLAANGNRRGYLIYCDNAAAQRIYVLDQNAGVASATHYSYQLGTAAAAPSPSTWWSDTTLWTGEVWALAASATGFVMVTEYT